MASIRQHRLRWKATVRIPKALEARYGTKFLYRNLSCTDKRAAKLEADAWETALRLEWAATTEGPAPGRAVLRDIYARLRTAAEAGEFLATGDRDDPDEITAGIRHEIAKLADRYGDDDEDVADDDRARLAALNDAIMAREGQPTPRRAELEATFSDLAKDFMVLWRTQDHKKANTEQQKLATFDLFAGFWEDRPIRDVRKGDAAKFVDALRQMDPLWARSSKARSLKWPQLVKEFGGREKGLADGTINRHMATLASLWKWGQEREHCEGNNPFVGFHRKLKDGRNVKGYLAWSPEELRHLFDPAPKRDDVTEIMLVAMFSGMRLDEIASLTYGRVKTEAGVTFIQVDDSKTAAGIRPVPLHPRLGWLKGRAKGKPAAARLWPDFNGEGPGKKAGADAGKEFSNFKIAKGYTDRRRVFHSFRKNFVGQLEARSVPQSEVAQIVGHEKGFTFGKYGAGVSLKRMARIVAMIDYPGLVLPEPAPA